MSIRSDRAPIRVGVTRTPGSIIASAVQFKPLDTQARLIISNNQPIYIYLTTRRGDATSATRVRLVQDSRPRCDNLTTRRGNRRFHTGSRPTPSL
jgi:hypothetical protein